VKIKIFGKHVFVRSFQEDLSARYALGRDYVRTIEVRTLSMMAFAFILLALPARAQNFTSVTASNLQSNVSGTKVARGQACMTPTDNNDQLVIVHDANGLAASTPSCATVTAGAIAAGYQVANPATTTPAGIYYRFQVTDQCAACATRNQIVIDLRLVALSGASFNLDTYIPTGVTIPPTGGSVNGPLTVVGNFTVTGTCTGCGTGGGGGSGYATIQNAGTALAQQATANFFSGITCANNAGASRTDCQLDQSITPTWTGAHLFNASVNLAGGFKINGAAAAGKIPIGDGTNFVPGDPLVQGLFAEGTTTAQNPVAIGGFDTAGTPAVHGAKVLNGTPAGTEYGLVTRPIPSGTQAVSGTVTANAGTGTFNIQANASVNETQVAGTAIDVNSGVKSAGTQRIVIATDQPQLTNALKVDGSAVTQPVSGTVTANQGGTWTVQPGNTANTTAWKVDGSAVTQPVSGTVTANVGTTNGLALDATLTGGSQKTKILGNGGAALDAAGQNAASPANELLIAGQFNTSPTTITSGNVSPIQLDNAGNLKVNIQSGGGTGGTASSFAAAFPASGTAIGVKNGANMVNLAADGSSNLLVNCAAGCSAAGDQSTGSTALGSNGATITLPLTGDNKATFQLQSAGTGVYTVTPQCSLDGGTLYNVNGYIQDPVSGAISTTATVASAQATTDYPIICPQGSSHAQMKVTAYTSGTANWVARATVNSGPALAFASVATSAPSPSNNTVAPLSMNTAGGLRVDGSAVTQPVSGTVTANEGGTWTVQPGNTANTTAWKVDGSAVTQPISAAALPLPAGASTSAKQPALGTAGSASTDVLSVQGIASMTALKVDGSAVTQPVSGTITANIGTAGTLALDASVAALEVAQASTTSGQKGAVVQGAVTTNAPTYTTAQTDPLSLDTSGLLRVSLKDTPQNTTALKVDGSAVTQPVSIAANVAATDAATSATGSAVPAKAAYIGGSDGANLVGMYLDPCKRGAKTRFTVNLTASGQIITGTSAKKTYICDLDITTATAQNIALVEGTGSTCATGIAGMAGGTTAATGWQFAANGGLTKGNGDGGVFSADSANADNVCLLLSGTGQTSGSGHYVQF
jgi:hypothetical protein